MANKSKQLTKEEVLEQAKGLEIEDRLFILQQIEKSIKDEASKMQEVGALADRVLDAINGKK